jgi:hypothetical protein
MFLVARVCVTENGILQIQNENMDGHFEHQVERKINNFTGPLGGLGIVAKIILKCALRKPRVWLWTRHNQLGRECHDGLLSTWK